MKKGSAGFTRRAFMGAAAGFTAAGIVGKAASARDGSSAARTPEAASASAGETASGAPAGPKVVCVHSADVFKGTQLDPQAVSGMLDAGVRGFSGRPPQDFWKSLFASDDVVGIKLNCISRTVRPNKPLIDAVIEGLKSAGVKENNVIVWDRFEDQLERRARLKINRGTEGVRIYGTERSGDASSGYDDKVFYETDKDTPDYRGSTGTKSLVTKIITTACTKIINMPVLKDHNQAGVSGCLKNLAFGAVNNTARFHKAPMYCSPAIADILLIPSIRQKTVLHILDALRVCYNGGPDAPNPAYVTNHSTLYMATDPVACDTVALEVVQKMRADAGLGDLFQTSGHPVHVAEAAAKGLGVGDRGRIDLLTQEFRAGAEAD